MSDREPSADKDANSKSAFAPKPTRQRQIPVPSHTSRFFWEALRRGKLALQFDPIALRYQFWPRANSTITGTNNLVWREVSGRGTVYSYTVCHVPAPGFEERTPYLMGLIDLDEGVRIAAPILNCDINKLRIGQRVSLIVEEVGDVRYYAFGMAA